MNEDEVRIIVRDELARFNRDEAARTRAGWDQYEAARQEKLADVPCDGPVARHIKAILRGEDAA